jgi:hypothetical protein
MINCKKGLKNLGIPLKSIYNKVLTRRIPLWDGRRINESKEHRR